MDMDPMIIDDDNEVVFDEPKSVSGFHTISYDHNAREGDSWSFWTQRPPSLALPVEPVANLRTPPRSVDEAGDCIESNHFQNKP